MDLEKPGLGALVIILVILTVKHRHHHKKEEEQTWNFFRSGVFSEKSD